jgi:site-specific recombinase XerD
MLSEREVKVVDIQTAVDEFILANCDKQGPTQDWYKQKAIVFGEWCIKEDVDLTQMRPSHYRRFLESLKARESDRSKKSITSYTLHGYAQVVKTFLRFCAVEGFISKEVYANIVENTRMPKVDQKIIETFSVDQIRRLVAAAEREAYPQRVARDRALLYTLLDTGIQVGECIGLTLDRAHLNEPEPYIRVFGKGRKEREVGMSQKAAREVRRYIQRYREGPVEEQHVFLGRAGKPLTASGVDQIN